MWEKKGGSYTRSNKMITVGSVVQCGCTVRVNKGRVYFDLLRDIVFVESGTKSASYFSDEDV